MGDTVKCVSDHAEDLADGRVLAPGQTADDVDLSVEYNRQQEAAGKILKVDTPSPSQEPPLLTGDALQKRARELDIAGRSTMDVDELRAAVEAAENDDKKENAS